MSNSQGVYFGWDFTWFKSSCNPSSRNRRNSWASCWLQIIKAKKCQKILYKCKLRAIEDILQFPLPLPYHHGKPPSPSYARKTTFFGMGGGEGVYPFMALTLIKILLKESYYPFNNFEKCFIHHHESVPVMSSPTPCSINLNNWKFPQHGLHINEKPAYLYPMNRGANLWIWVLKECGDTVSLLPGFHIDLINSAKAVDRLRKIKF